MRDLFNKIPQKRFSAKDLAYEEIKQKILSGKIQPNEPIIEEEIAKSLEISRTPLREALQLLEYEDLVLRQQNGRLKVTAVSMKEAKEIFNVRILLEGACVKEATVNCTEEDIQNLTKILLMKDANKDGKLEDVLFYGGYFHSYIYDLSGNTTFSKILTQLNDHIYRYRFLLPEQETSRVEEEAKEHREILQFMANKEADNAEKAMKQHIQNSLDVVLEAIKQFENKQ